MQKVKKKTKKIGKNEFVRGDLVHGIIKSPISNLFTMNYMVYLGISQKEKGSVDVCYYGTNLVESVFKKRIFHSYDTDKAFKYMEKLIREYK